MRRRPGTLAAVVLAALLAVGCGDDDSGSQDATTTTGAPTSTTADPYGRAPTTAAPDDGGDATVSLGQVAELGEVLVGPNGHTLYLFDSDDGTTSACTGGCAATWPALATDGEPVAGGGVDAAELATADGQVAGHVTYGGHLLYFYAGDQAPGEANGASIPGWHPVSAGGEPVGG